MAKILQQLPAAPGLSEIHHFLSQAMERRGRQVVISWATPDKLVEFSLEIQCPIKGGDTEWKLFSGKDRERKLLWEYKTCDVLLVYNLIVSSSGEIHHAVQIDGAIMTSEAFRDQSRKRDTYYMQAMQTHEVDIARLSQLGLKDNSWSRGTAEHTGDLSIVQISSLLQSLLIAKLTGCLEINKSNEKARIFFVDGEPTYADIAAGRITGDECILEIVTWREGKYEFIQRQRTEHKNVKTSLETLVLQGVKLKDQTNYLKNAGLGPDSVLVQKYLNITQPEFDARTTAGAPVALQVLRSIYVTIDSESTLKTIATRLHLPQSVWVPAIIHLLELDLIGFTNPEQNKSAPPENLIPKSIDPTLIHSVMMGLRRPETGMFTYPAFLYFLEQEYFRGYRAGSPLCVMVMEMRVVKGPPNFEREPLDVVAVAEVFRRISALKRHIDLVAHYESYDYAMILPNTKSSGANVFAQRIVNTLLSSPLPGVQHGKLSLSFGVACIPEDCTDLSYVLAAAEAAKAQAILLAAPVILFRDIRPGAE
jgi:GGDEF domain-containing protein